jgi:hypothetical protein
LAFAKMWNTDKVRTTAFCLASICSIVTAKLDLLCWDTKLNYLGWKNYLQQKMTTYKTKMTDYVWVGGGVHKYVYSCQWISFPLDTVNLSSLLFGEYCHSPTPPQLNLNSSWSDNIRIEDILKAKHILPGNLTNTTTNSKLEQFKQKINHKWLWHNSKST